MFNNDTPSTQKNKGGIEVRYFYKTKATGNKENVVNFFILTSETENPKENDKPKIPQLTEAMLNKNSVYKELANRKFGKIMVDYHIYSTESDLAEIAIEDLDEHLQTMIDDKTAVFHAKSELVVMFGKSGKPITGGKKKNKKQSKLLNAFTIGAAVIFLVVGIGLGTLLGGKLGGDNDGMFGNQDLEFDGLIMPDDFQQQFDPNAELLTISIDRSYSPVPREDIQIKGEVIDGVATITLPHFDRTEFFSHVPGHTWGWTSDPNGTKIEYYGGKTYEFTQPVKLYRVLVKFGGGNGTKDDPYLLNYFDQLTLMSQEKVRGYFRQIEDIEFPHWADHEPINTVNELKRNPQYEYFEYDGGGFVIDGLTAPLFGTISGSIITNVNIINANIETSRYKNYGFLVCEAFNYRYEVGGTTYETGETIIKNSTVSHSTIHVQIPADEIETIPPAQPPTIPPDAELSDEELLELYNLPVVKHGEYAIGGITGLGGQIENCYVTNVEIFMGLSDYFLYAGGISGKPANVTNSGVNFLSIEGNIFHAGGIAGSGGGSRLYKADGTELPIFYGGNIQGCFVRDFKAYVETSAGGIIGEGSTNAENALISNSYAMGLDFKVGVFEGSMGERETPVIIGITGGIIGTDGNERYGHLVVNTVSDSCYRIVGSLSKSRLDETVRLAPLHAFYQEGMLDVLNRNTIHPNNPETVIFTGSFVFADDERNNGVDGRLPFPAEIAELFEKTIKGEVQHE